MSHAEFDEMATAAKLPPRIVSALKVSRVAWQQQTAAKRRSALMPTLPRGPSYCSAFDLPPYLTAQMTKQQLDRLAGTFG